MYIRPILNPYLSIVLAGRNDNYGGDFRSRLQHCVSALYAQLSRFGISSEILFVNYNPLPQPDISEFIAWPRSTETVAVRIVTVPADVHVAFVAETGVKNVPVNEYFAKNIGIRRSRGRYVLCMNPDILFDDASVARLANLSDDRYYRANRCDFTAPPAPVDDLLSFAKTHVSKVWIKGISREFPGREITPADWRRLETARKWETFRYGLLRKFNFLWRHKLHPKAEYRYHCNVSGDFMLMSREAWLSTGGYDQGMPISLHVDALMVVRAAVSGLQETLLDEPVYYQEHERRYDADVENPEFRRAYLNFQAEAEKMIRKKSITINNAPDWGREGREQPELIL